MKPRPVLALRGLSLEFPTYRGAVQALSRVSVEVEPGEIVALVGESGSGKSVAAMAAIRLFPPNLTRVTAGSIAVAGHDTLAATERELAEMRGKLVSMVFQEPMSALNPTMRIGEQITQVLRRHKTMDRARAAELAARLLAEMQVSDPIRVMRSYPFELSGGMRQRVLIAMAFSGNPKLLIADEPTTALDVTVQAQVLDLIRERARARGTAVLLITHDLAVVSQLCTRVYVMYAGEIVESGATRDVLLTPRHPYTRALLESLPESARPRARLRSIRGTVPSLLEPPAGCRFRARCDRARDRCQEPPPFLVEGDSTPRGAACWFADEASTTSATRVETGMDVNGLTTVKTAADANARGMTRSRADAADAPRPPPASAPKALVTLASVEVRFPVGTSWGGRPAAVVHAVNGVDLEILKGETLAIVGESGCGKSTLAQLVMALLAPTEGRVRFDGIDLRGLSADKLRETRRRLQMVFQDPQASLDPRMSAWRVISEPLWVTQRLGTSALRERAAELAELVGIRSEHLERYPHEFSGGQRQRLAIARAVALQPELLVLDEPTSALDVSIQAQILNLLRDLQTRFGLTYLFISHNVAVVRHSADRVAVMYLGQVVELGTAELVLDEPKHPYTQQLIRAVPRLGQELTAPLAASEPASNLHLPAGCYFRSRCTQANELCREQQVLRRLADGRHVRCHLAE